MRVLKRVQERFGARVSVQIFGCSQAELVQHGLDLNFTFHNHGILRREGVAELLRSSDIFLDLSDYQAFGRTAAEAMACGCVVFVTRDGGANEFCADGENGFLVDVHDEDSVYDHVSRVVEDESFRRALSIRARQTAARYSPVSAALSELTVFLKAMQKQETSRFAAFSETMRYTGGGHQFVRSCAIEAVAPERAE